MKMLLMTIMLAWTPHQFFWEVTLYQPTQAHWDTISENCAIDGGNYVFITAEEGDYITAACWKLTRSYLNDQLRHT